MNKIKPVLAYIIILSMILLSNKSVCQVGIGTTSPNQSAALDVSNNSKGLLIPRMTSAQKGAISLPATGLIVYQTDGQTGFYYNSGTPGLPVWSFLFSSESAPWLANGNNIYNTNTGNIGVGTQTPLSLFSAGANSEFQIDNSGNIRMINNVPYSFPPSQGLAGQVLSNNGSGNLSWVNSGEIYTLNSSNYTSVTVPNDNYVRVQGTITLSADYSGLDNNNLLVCGGVFDGGSTQKLNLGQNCVFSGVTFNNIELDGSTNNQFIACRFNNVTEFPFECSITGCIVNNSVVTTTSRIAYINNTEINTCSIPRIERISNCDILNSTLGNSSNYIYNVVGNRINNTSIYSQGAFTGNHCDDSRVLAEVNLTATNISGNNFDAGSITTNLIEVNVNGSARGSVTICNNNFLGNSSAPVSEYISISGSYTGNYFTSRVSNNTVTRGPQLLTVSTSGPVYLIVNDNLLRLTGGIGVSSGGFITVRNNDVF